MSIASCVNGVPYSCSLFYAFDEMNLCMYFLTSPSSRHGKEIMHNGRVSGTILGQHLMIANLKGIQFTGISSLLDTNCEASARKVYTGKFPVTSFSKERIWVLKPDWIKMTDNSLGFGTKFIWDAKLSK